MTKKNHGHSIDDDNGNGEDGERHEAAIASPPYAARGLRRVRYEEGVDRAVLDTFAVNPHQRNTLGRAPAAADTYLANLEDPHLEIAVVHCLEDGVTYLLNGHTRREVWNSLMLPPSQVPAKVNITYYEADTRADVVRGYEMFDSAQAVKTKGDEVYGALRQVGYQPRSPMIVNAAWLEQGLRATMALTHGQTIPVKVSEGEAKSEMLLANIEEWLREIVALDNIGFGSEFNAQENDKDGKPVLIKRKHPRLAPVNIGVAALMAIRRDGEEAIEFLTAIRDKKGIVESPPGQRRGGLDQFDAVRMVMAWASYKADATLRLKVDESRALDWGIFLTAYETWRGDRERGDITMFSDYPKWSGKMKNLLRAFHIEE